MTHPDYNFALTRATMIIGMLSVLLFPGKSQAHEYWLEPARFEIKTGEPIEADLRNGENFKGNRLYYLTNNFTRFDILTNSSTIAAKGSNGDQPALSHKTTEPGLHILSYQSTFSTIGFKEWEKFLTYLNNQGLEDIAAQHEARGLAKSGFVESYARTIKALIKVGNGQGNDRHTGLPYEFVAQENPYLIPADRINDAQIKVTLLIDAKPAINRQVLIFQDNGTVTMKTARTDEHGLVSVSLAGGGKFMLSSVHMFAGDSDPATEKTEWYSYWANLVFAVPGADNSSGK